VVVPDEPSLRDFVVVRPLLLRDVPARLRLLPLPDGEALARFAVDRAAEADAEPRDVAERPCVERPLLFFAAVFFPVVARAAVLPAAVRDAELLRVALPAFLVEREAVALPRFVVEFFFAELVRDVGLRDVADLPAPREALLDAFLRDAEAGFFALLFVEAEERLEPRAVDLLAAAPRFVDADFDTDAALRPGDRFDEDDDVFDAVPRPVAALFFEAVGRDDVERDGADLLLVVRDAEPRFAVVPRADLVDRELVAAALFFVLRDVVAVPRDAVARAGVRDAVARFVVLLALAPAFALRAFVVEPVPRLPPFALLLFEPVVLFFALLFDDGRSDFSAAVTTERIPPLFAPRAPPLLLPDLPDDLLPDLLADLLDDALAFDPLFEPEAVLLLGLLGLDPLLFDALPPDFALVRFAPPRAFFELAPPSSPAASAVRVTNFEKRLSASS
jgi:hypothetical protein